MKKTQLNILLKTVFIGAMATIMLVSFSSCATKAKFAASSTVPAARGDVKVKNDKNNNYSIEIAISNLAEVDRLQPAKNTYVVWLVSDKDETKNIGQFKSSSGMFSKNLKASFETVTSYKPSKIFITAEDDETVLYPSGQLILSTDRF